MNKGIGEITGVLKGIIGRDNPMKLEERKKVVTYIINDINQVTCAEMSNILFGR